MAQRLDARGETWDVRLSREEARDGVKSVIFRCASNSSYGWRVVGVPAGEYESQEGLQSAPEAELHGLFERSQPFGYSHDPKARQDPL